MAQLDRQWDYLRTVSPSAVGRRRLKPRLRRRRVQAVIVPGPRNLRQALMIAVQSGRPLWFARR